MMRKTAFILLAALLPSLAMAQMRRTARYERYFDTYWPLAVEQMRKYGIPASITLAQGVYESGAGESRLATAGNNHFGIKCHGWTGRTTWADDDAPDECFRAYPAVRDSYEDHSLFLRSGQRYRGLFSLKPTDYKGWARGLKAAGYATNPRYADKLIEIIGLYGLDRFDCAGCGAAVEGPRLPRGIHISGGLYKIYIYNKVYYVRARQGDTYASIGRELGLSARKLAKYNDREAGAELVAGEAVFLRRKRGKAPKSVAGGVHYVRSGESLYSISQMYAVRLKSICKMNPQAAAGGVSVGQEVRVRN